MKLFKTDRKESFHTKTWRLVYNFLPPIWGTGSWMAFLSDDWYEAHVKLSLNLRTRNYVGTIFGGSLFSSTDPIYMIQLYKVLGNQYVVWDKSANIRFIRPGKGKLKACFLLRKAEIEDIKEQIQQNKEVDRTFIATWINQDGKPVARIEKTIYIADKAHYQAKRAAKNQHTPRPKF